MFYAARGFAAKSVSAGGIIGAGTIVSLVGLDGITSLELVTQEIRMNLALAFLPLYCALFLLGLLIVSRYRIDRQGHRENLESLAARRASRSA